MMDTLLANTRELKNHAKPFLQHGQLDSALSSLDKAIAMLESALKQEGVSIAPGAAQNTAR